MRIALPLAWLALLGAAPSGEPAPPLYVDPRIRTITYNENEVVPVSVAPGFQLTVEMGRGEHIENVAIGDSEGWLATPNKRGDFLFIKPSQGAGTTNLTVVTEARTYLFELSAGSGTATPYTLRFRYDTEEMLSGEAEFMQAPGRFRFHGARSIKPAEMFDDGHKTYILFKPNGPLPAIFALNADGSEMLPGGAMRDGRYVVDGLANRFVLRLDKQVVVATRKPKLKD